MLANHGKVVHQGITFDCEQCGKKYRSRDVLKRHIDIIHNKMVFTFKCKREGCDKIYN